MKLAPIVLKLRAASTRFENRIAGAAELALAVKGTLTNEMAFVIQLAEDASPNNLDTGINQKITERFAVVVALRNDISARDKTGLAAYDSLHDVRAELWRAILGWQMPGMEDVVSYGGGTSVSITRAYLWYRYEFVVGSRIGLDDGVTQEAVDDFNSIWTQWVLMPSADVPISEGLPVTLFAPDMESMIDMTRHPDEGEFWRGFGLGFDIYKRSER